MAPTALLRCDACSGVIAEGDDTVSVGGRTFHAACIESTHVEPDANQERRGRIARWGGWLGWGQGA